MSKFTITTCSICGKNSRVLVESNEWQTSFCKKHLPDEYKKEMERTGFRVADI